MRKTYVCSDVHSHLRLFDRALAILDKDDTLYVLGDVIDKGPDGLGVLLRIMADPRCKLILGNHELMMLQYLSLMNHGVPQSDYEFSDVIRVWCFRNGGMMTISRFFTKSKVLQDMIYEFLLSCPLAKYIDINGQRFLLTHAFLPDDITEFEDELPLSELLMDPYKGSYDWRHDVAWERRETHIDGVTVITGHTPVLFSKNDRIIRHGNWFDIDCGLATNRASSSLALLCLDNMKVRYFPLGELAVPNMTAENSKEVSSFLSRAE